ncbi:MAG: prepilin-type N-terminal cleavage/methylation domain-containing protein [Kiritimatiellia bacterium]|jgi:prepilin-type N-terminal cleavage/methylation domain-containing protein
MRTRFCQRPTGFSLLELLVVIAIATILLSLSAGTYKQTTRRMEIQGEAEALASLLRSARQYAMDHRVRTRVVFADQELEEFSKGVLSGERSYAAYALYIPALPNGGTEFLSFKYGDVRSSGKFLPEFASMPFNSVPSGFVAQWRPMPGEEEWRTPPPRVGIQAFGWPEASLKTGYANPDFFQQSIAKKAKRLPRQSRDRWLSDYYFNPAKFWDHTSTRYYYPNTPFARYPQNYFQTPFPLAYPLTKSRLMPEEPSVIINPNNNNPFTYAEMWTGNQDYAYFTGVETHLKDFRKLGQVEDLDSPDRRFFNLPGIEFSNNGLPTFTWADHIVIRVRSQRNSRHTVDIVIDRRTGIAKTTRLDEGSP